MYDIVVLGAGIVGLSTAVNIQRLVPERQVTVIADKFTRDTTSDGAAGIFRVTLMLTPEKSVERYRKWCVDSFNWYHEVHTKFDPKDTGVIRVSGYEFSKTKREYPFHHDIIYDFRELGTQELQNFPGNHKYGWNYTTLMTESRRYLPWLTQRFLSTGGRIEERTVANVKENRLKETILKSGHNIGVGGEMTILVLEYAQFAGHCSVVVNCCGIRAGELFNDKHVYPVRGHLIRVNAPWLKQFFVAAGACTYIYTGQDNVVLGGTRHVNVSDTNDSEKWFQDVLQRCQKLVPALEGAEIVGKWVGFRPHRTYIRIETETFDFNGKQLQVVHNYGHGANGIALSWGTSVDAAHKVCDVIRNTSAVSSKL